MRDPNQENGARVSAAIIPGLIVAGIGVLFLLHNLNIVRIYNVWRFWPLILIAIGFTKLVDSPHSNEKAGGSVMVLVGGIFLAVNLGLFSWQSGSSGRSS